jgi:hypothetical protein
MRRFTTDTLAAICAEIGRGEDAAGGGMAAGPWDDIAAFVAGQVGSAPAHLRVGLGCATAAFGLCGLRHGAPFHRLGPELRRRQMDRWRSSRFGAARDLMRFYDSLCLVALYSRPAGAPKDSRAR